ncbi:MAG: thermonuclease family protein [Rhodobacteraceae bacterium]|nr:thermonuclease family protein [Paracoccaceae bacterium]
MMRLKLFSCGAVISLIASFSFASASELDVRSRTTVFEGPYTAEVVRVIDGDTVEAVVALWPGLIAHYSIRVRGIDAPEIRGAACEKEQEWGLRAKQQVERLYPVGTSIRLKDVQYDVWSGRMLADIQRFRSDRWLSLSKELLDRGLAVAWETDSTEVPWCLLISDEATPPDVMSD